MSEEDRVFRLRPTASAIKRGNVVLIKRFVDAHSEEIDWNAFETSLLGNVLAGERRLDRQRRLGLPLRELLSVGDMLSFCVRDRRLVVEKED